MSTGGPVGSDPSADLERDLWLAVNGDPRHGHLDVDAFGSLIARADALGDPTMSFRCRLAAAEAADYRGRLVDELTATVWMLRAMRAPMPGLVVSAAEHEKFHVVFASVVLKAVELPEIPLETVGAMLDDWEALAREHGCHRDIVPVRVRAAIAVHEGRYAAAQAILDACHDHTAMPWNCEASGRAAMAGAYTGCGPAGHSAAIALCEPDLVDDGRHCGYYPAETLSPMMLPYAAAGRRDEVVRAARSMHRHFGEFTSDAPIWAEGIAALLMVDALDDAHAMALEHLRHLDRPFSPYGEAMVASAIAATLWSQAEWYPDSVVAHRVGEDRGAAAGSSTMRPAAAVADELAERARRIAARFDIRNRSTHMSGLVEQRLALRGRGVLEASSIGAVSTGAASTVVEATPVGKRSARELLQGTVSYAHASVRRAAECADALRTRIDELGERDRLRAVQTLAWDRRRTDPVLAAAEIRDAAAQARAGGRPDWADQGEYLAMTLDVEAGRHDPADLDTHGIPDPHWPPMWRARSWRLRGLIRGGGDPEWGIADLDRGLAALAEGDAVEPTPREREWAAESPESWAADRELLIADLHHHRALMRGAIGEEFGEDADAAVRAARRALPLTTTPDQRQQARGALVEALRMVAGDQSHRDPAGALTPLDEAIEHARFVQRAEVLAHRCQVRESVGDLDGAVEDADQARAVLVVEGLDGAALLVTVDLASVMLDRHDDPQQVIDLISPVITRLSEIGDEHAADRGRRVLASAQAAGNLHRAAAQTIGRVVDDLPDDVDDHYRAQLLYFRAEQLSLDDQDPEAAQVYATSAEAFTRAGDQVAAAGAWRCAARTRNFLLEIDSAREDYARAEEILATLVGSEPAVMLARAELDVVIADVERRADPERSLRMLAGVAEFARTGGEFGLLISAQRAAALTELDRGDPTAAVAHIDAALSVVDSPGLVWLRADIVGGDS